MKPGSFKNLGRYLTIIIAMLIIQTHSEGQSLSSIVQATNTFLKTLNEEQLKQTQFEFNDSLRIKWSNFPIAMVPRSGIRYGDLSDANRIAFHEMLSTILSSQGYLKITGIMQLDDMLNELTNHAHQKGQINADMKSRLDNLKWGHDNYFISIWGKPDAKEPWSFKLGGHHMALSLTMHGEKISFTPLFVGTDPAQVSATKHAGWRVLSKEEDYGFALVNFLSKEQKEKAILKQAVPKDIITNPESSQRITSYYGIAAKEFNKDQLEIFKILIQEYLHNFEHQVAHGLYDRILKTGFDKVYFAWVGGTERHTPHYYIINGPDFLIEYDNVGFQNDGNHIHAILREKDNDFGADILKDHYQNSDHHNKK
jgi:hypothetical protein